MHQKFGFGSQSSGKEEHVFFPQGDFQCPETSNAIFDWRVLTQYISFICRVPYDFWIIYEDRFGSWLRYDMFIKELGQSQDPGLPWKKHPVEPSMAFATSKFRKRMGVSNTYFPNLDEVLLTSFHSKWLYILIKYFSNRKIHWRDANIGTCSGICLWCFLLFTMVNYPFGRILLTCSKHLKQIQVFQAQFY